MVKKDVFFQTMSDIQNFNKIAFRCDYDVDLQQGKYLVDACLLYTSDAADEL